MTSPGTLFVVATPIGNLEDITLRALRVLREVDLVAAEDTRRTGNLLRHYEIQTPLLSMHAHNEAGRVERVLERLRSGRSVAVVSDAGTPGISDPGAILVRAARAAGFPVVPVPGPSAVAAAVSVLGLTETRFVFAGFAPTRSNDRNLWLRRVAEERDLATIFFEAPHRVLRTLADFRQLLVERPIIVGREISKVHEEWRTGTADELIAAFPHPQGEFVLAIMPASEPERPQGAITDEQIVSLFGEMTKSNALGRRAAVRAVAEQLRLAPNAVYTALERGKRSGD